MRQLSNIPFPFFGWLSFVVLGTIYTALCLGGFSGDGSVFSKKNTIPLSRVVLVHLTFLSILLVAFEFGSLLALYLPDWLTDESIRTHGGSYSYLELMLVIGGGGTHLIERRWLYVEVDPDQTNEVV